VEARKGKESMSDKKHYVLTYMDANQDRSKTYAIYQGELEDFPIKVSYWDNDGYLIVPNWFESLYDAMEYIKNLGNHTIQTYYLVQERHYAEGDPRIAVAKIIFSIKNDFPIQPERGKTQERYGDPTIDVWTMFFLGKDVAEQYVNAFNADVANAKLVVQK
jgi:hypothetical protein